MELFDYVIMTDTNEWISTGRDETQKQLDDEISIKKEEYPDNTLVIFKAKKFETFSV